MNDLRFYILFNSVSVISGRWSADKAACNGTTFTIESFLRILQLEVMKYVIVWSKLAYRELTLNI